MIKKVTAFTSIIALSAILMLGSQIYAQTDDSAPAGEPQTLVMWSSLFGTTEVERQLAIITQFEEAHPDIRVQLVVMDTALMTEMLRVTTEAGVVPDVILHPLEATYRWYNAGYLNAQAATQLINELGLETFSPAARRLLRVEEATYAAIPSDGWTNLIIYRADWFAEDDLPVPDTLPRLREAIQQLANRDDVPYGVCGPLTLSEVTGNALEHLALATSTRFVDPQGNFDIVLDPLSDALNFYVSHLRDYGPDTRYTLAGQPLLRYLAGECAVLFGDARSLDAIAGLQESRPVTCPACADDPSFLAANTGFVSLLTSDPEQQTGITRGSMLNLGLPGAVTPALQTFVQDYFSDSYLDWLAIDPRSRQPLRFGTEAQPRLYLQGWTELTIGVDRRGPISSYYSEDSLNQLLAGLEAFDRLGATPRIDRFLSVVLSEGSLQQNAFALYNGRIDLETAVFNIERRLMLALAQNLETLDLPSQ